MLYRSTFITYICNAVYATLMAL